MHLRNWHVKMQQNAKLQEKRTIPKAGYLQGLSYRHSPFRRLNLQGFYLLNFPDIIKLVKNAHFCFLTLAKSDSKLSYKQSKWKIWSQNYGQICEFQIRLENI